MDRIIRKEPVQMSQLVKLFILDQGLTAGFNARRIYAAWDAVSGASGYTINRTYRNGTLYCTISSSVVRNNLSMSRSRILMELNTWLMNDELFIKTGSDGHIVRNIVLK